MRPVCDRCVGLVCGTVVCDLKLIICTACVYMYLLSEYMLNSMQLYATMR